MLDIKMKKKNIKREQKKYIVDGWVVQDFFFGEWFEAESSSEGWNRGVDHVPCAVPDLTIKVVVLYK